MRTRAWALAWCCMLGACPGDDAASKQSTSPCPAWAKWEQSCDRDAPYWGDTECPQAAWRYVRPEVTDAIIECLGELGCDESDDRCGAAGLTAIGIDEESDVEDDALFQECLTRAHECSTIDDVCTSVLGYTATGRSKAMRCLDVDCSMFKACLKDPDVR